jgi:hypothetical protein
VDDESPKPTAQHASKTYPIATAIRQNVCGNHIGKPEEKIQRADHNRPEVNLLAAVEEADIFSLRASSLVT